MLPFGIIFFAAVLLALACRLWLGWRHIRHVAAHRGAVPAGFAERIPLAAHQKAAAYTIDRSRAGLVTSVADSGLLLALTLGGGIAWLHELWAARLDGIAYGLAMIFSLLIISTLVDLPFTLYRQFVIEARHGFNRMTLALFVADLAKQALLGLVIGTPAIAAVLWLMGAMGAAWWFWVWLFWAAFNLLLLFVYPTWIAPLFNKFTPLDGGETKSRIESLLERCGFRAAGLFVMDGSKRSSHGNAYFTGFGNNKRIVFFDTLLERLTPGEIEAVLAHELGHFRKKHVVQRIAFLFAGSLLFLWLLGLLIDSPWFYAGLGVPAQNMALALILFFLAAPVFAFPLSPLLSRLSRRHEFEADAYAAAHSAAADLVRALVKLYEDNAATLTPDPLYSAFYDSHPPAAQRIARLQAA
ncbi:MAG: M48 family metallopeptidase [Betaproteobacteria bacterium]|nr:M48 family metallopeptidase [Betaproteobacteria bacterium]MCL2887451.1 M48 family metallopeptidase [Betaproteobacteria bacterium]